MQALYYFDVSGNAFSLPNGFQYVYEGKYYKVKIETYVPLAKKYRSMTYDLNVILPAGNTPLVTVG